MHLINDLGRELPDDQELALYLKEKIDDLLGLRLVVESEEDCDVALIDCISSISNIGKLITIDDRFKYTRPNETYQAIHAKFRTRNGTPLEVQIRDEKHHYEAEMGEEAAHWVYKYRNTPAILQGDVIEEDIWNQWFETFSELFRHHVYSVTEAGEVVRLSKNSSLVDFAARQSIFKEGNFRFLAEKMEGPSDRWANGEVSRGEMQPQEKLLSFQRIRIQSVYPSHGPDPAWLNYAAETETRKQIVHALVKSAEGMKHIREWSLTTLDDELRMQPSYWHLYDFMASPMSVIDKLEQIEGDTGDYLSKIAIGGKEKAKKLIQDVKEHYKDYYRQQYSVYEQNKYAAMVNYFSSSNNFQRVFSSEQFRFSHWQNLVKPINSPQSSGILACTFGICCCPIPHDPIIGYFEQDENIGDILVVHKQGCRVSQLHKGEHCSLRWNISDVHARGENGRGGYPSGIDVLTFDRPGVVDDILTVFSSKSINIDEVYTPRFSMWTNIQDKKVAVIEFGLNLISEEEYKEIASAILRDIQKEGPICVMRQPYPSRYFSEWQIKNSNR
jgi:(p)ppGpp synthase/HD superfamily hydrolase